MKGWDVQVWIQRIMSNEIKFLQNELEADEAVQRAFYCAFLEPGGRMIAPAFLYPGEPPSKLKKWPTIYVEALLMDCCVDSRDALLKHLAKFKLRSKIKIQDQTDQYSLWSVWGTEPHEIRKLEKAYVQSFEELENFAMVQVYRDERTPGMGLRILTPRHSSPFSDDQPPKWLKTLPKEIQEAYDAMAASPDANFYLYDVHRRLQGVPDHFRELGPTSLPLEANMDHMGGVDYRKGCYIGQELTARTHHTGVIRKRVMPVKLRRPGYAPDSDPPHMLVDIRVPPRPGAESRKFKSAGKLLSVVKSPEGESLYIGLARLRLNEVLDAEEMGRSLVHFGDQNRDAEQDEIGAWEVEAVWPDWWPKSVREELIKGRQASA